MKIIEFKAKETGKTWEKTPVLISLGDIVLRTEEEIEVLANRLANALDCEIRWNYEGIGQGHYVQPEVKDAV